MLNAPDLPSFPRSEHFVSTIDFERSDDIAAIAGAMAKAQGAMPKLAKNKTATITGVTKAGKPYEYTYDYADIAEVLEAMRKPLSDNGLAVVQLPVSVHHTDDPAKPVETVGLVTLVAHESGQWLKATIDTGRYAFDNQDAGKSLTVYKRYTLQALGLLAAEADTDGQNLGGNRGRSPRRPEAAPAPPRETPRPAPHPDETFEGAAPVGSALPTPAQPQEAPDDSKPTTKGEKLAAWAARHGHTERAEALAQSNHNASVAQLGDAHADALYKVLVNAKLVEPKGRPPQGGVNENGNPTAFGWPKDGKSLYAWSFALERAFSVSVVKSIDAQFGPKSRYNWPGNFKEWSAAEVETAAVFAARQIAALPGYNGQFDRHLPDLADLRMDLAQAVSALSGHLGQPNPGFGAINAICQQHSAALDGHGGEVLDDLEQCDSEPLLRAVLTSVKRDVAEAEAMDL